MMTRLSVNLNKIALLRNSRGHNSPDLIEFAHKALSAGAGGITVHPRPDQRHTKYTDVGALSEFIRGWPEAELNIEGYPDETFIEVVLRHRPHQVTLVPDAPGQLTSDHGWDLIQHAEFVHSVVKILQQEGIRTSLFLDPESEQIDIAASIRTDRIELYTAAYAASYGTSREHPTLELYRQAAIHAQSAGLGVNAGHDLSLANLGKFITIRGILEVSIGHALTVESLDHGFKTVVKKYLDIIAAAAG